jgi:hypothetical protein
MARFQAPLDVRRAGGKEEWFQDLIRFGPAIIHFPFLTFHSLCPVWIFKVSKHFPSSVQQKNISEKACVVRFALLSFSLP